MLRTNGLLLASAALTARVTLASAPGGRARLLNDSLVGFLVFLVLLLALALIAIIRLEPPERGSAAEETPHAPAPASAFRAPEPPAPEFGQRPVSPAPLPRRSVGRFDQPGYTARHAPGPAPSQGTPDRPRVSGGPPWGPAPRPPGTGPFVRSPD